MCGIIQFCFNQQQQQQKHKRKRNKRTFLCRLQPWNLKCDFSVFKIIKMISNKTNAFRNLSVLVFSATLKMVSLLCQNYGLDYTFVSVA